MNRKHILNNRKKNDFEKSYIGSFQKQNNWKCVVLFGRIKDMYEI